MSNINQRINPNEIADAVIEVINLYDRSEMVESTGSQGASLYEYGMACGALTGIGAVLSETAHSREEVLSVIRAIECRLDTNNELHQAVSDLIPPLIDSIVNT